MIHTPAAEWPVLHPQYLQSARFLDSANEAVRLLAPRVIGAATTDVEKAVRLFHAVRDGWRATTRSPCAWTSVNTSPAMSRMARESREAVATAALIAGATDGIGKQTALELLEQGWRVLVHGRGRARAAGPR